jgi:hypothetical protein
MLIPLISWDINLPNWQVGLCYELAGVFLFYEISYGRSVFQYVENQHGRLTGEQVRTSGLSRWWRIHIHSTHNMDLKTAAARCEYVDSFSSNVIYTASAIVIYVLFWRWEMWESYCKHRYASCQIKHRVLEDIKTASLFCKIGNSPSCYVGCRAGRPRFSEGIYTSWLHAAKLGRALCSRYR